MPSLLPAGKPSEVKKVNISFVDYTTGNACKYNGQRVMTCMSRRRILVRSIPFV
jgi:hypothetical protein